jgi:hypothetical protein
MDLILVSRRGLITVVFDAPDYRMEARTDASSYGRGPYGW